MTPEKRAALVEKVARVIDSNAFRDEPVTMAINTNLIYPQTRAKAIAEGCIDLIRAEVLEEAAKVAEYRCGSTEWSNDTNSGYECAAKEIAAAIRALKERP